MTDQEKAEITALFEDAKNDVKLARDALAAVKQARAGDKTALMALIPQAVAEVRKDIADVQAALPVIKAGYKTSEFWLSAAIAGLIFYFHAMGKPLPFDADAALVGLSGVYSLVRSVVKKQA